MLHINSVGCIVHPSVLTNSVGSECLQVGCKNFFLVHYPIQQLYFVVFLGDISNTTESVSDKSVHL